MTVELPVDTTLLAFNSSRQKDEYSACKPLHFYTQPKLAQQSFTELEALRQRKVSSQIQERVHVYWMIYIILVHTRSCFCKVRDLFLLGESS